MITKDYIQMMARYSAWQNASIAKTADSISATERQTQRGAFFGTIEGTLNHLLWGDRIWMHRFANTDKPLMDSIPASINESNSWPEYIEARDAMNKTIIDWANDLDPAWLVGELSWFSGAVNREVSKSKQTLVVHFFNHGTHHRGQVHCMLTAAGLKPDDTDLPFMPE